MIPEADLFVEDKPETPTGTKRRAKEEFVRGIFAKLPTASIAFLDRELKKKFGSSLHHSVMAACRPKYALGRRQRTKEDQGTYTKRALLTDNQVAMLTAAPAGPSIAMYDAILHLREVMKCEGVIGVTIESNATILTRVQTQEFAI